MLSQYYKGPASLEHFLHRSGFVASVSYPSLMYSLSGSYSDTILHQSTQTCKLLLWLVQPWWPYCRLILHNCTRITAYYTTTILRPFFRDHPGEPVPEENFWTSWCKGRLTEADTLTIRLGATPSRLTTVSPTIFQRFLFWGPSPAWHYYTTEDIHFMASFRGQPE